MKALNWKPKWGFVDSLNYTINWYKSFYDGKAAYDCIISDIENFLSK